MKDRKKPAIRFKGFTEDWEQRKFADVVQIERGGSPRPIDAYTTDSSSGLNWVKIGDAPTQGHYITKTVEKIKPEGLSKTREVHPGDLILSNSMSFGKPYIMGIDGCIHDGWLLIRNINNTFDLTFLCHLLGTPQMLGQYKSLAAGSTVNNLNKELVGNTVVTIPEIDEQRVLGQYLERLDHLITLHQRKYDKLVNVKKSMLEKIFPKNGESIPDIRFSGFTEDWEHRKLSELCFLVTKGTTPLDKSSIGTVNFVKIESIDEVSGEIKIMQKITDEEHNGYLRRSQLKKGDILFSIAGTLGRVTAVKSGILPANTNQALAIIRLKSGCLQYIKTYLKGKAVADFIKENPTIGAQPNLSLEQVGNLEISLPTENEQKFIGAYFQHLNNLITLHQRKLEKLKNIKKSCLEKMFI